MADNEDLAAEVRRLAAAVDRLTAVLTPPPAPPTTEPCVRCDGRGGWGPGAVCGACQGSGTTPASRYTL